ncbi:MAG: Yip1 family protein [Sphingomonas sp.]
MATEPPSVTPTEPPAQPPAAADMIARIKAILIDPAAEWGRIDDEQTSVRAIMAGWVAPLAAIGPVAMLVRSLAFGFSVFGFTYWPSITEAVSQAISSYVMSLIGIFVLALIIDALAPSFGGTRDRVQALKVAAYGATAAWLAAVVNLLPGLGLLTLAGLYSLYLYYLGLPRLMRAPADKAPAYAGATIVAAVLLFLAVGWVVGAASASLFPRTISDGAVTGSLNVPGVGTFDANKVNDAAKRVQTLAQEMQAQQAAGHAAAGVTAPETLAAMLARRDRRVEQGIDRKRERRGRRGRDVARRGDLQAGRPGVPPDDHRHLDDGRDRRVRRRARRQVEPAGRERL